MQKFFQKYFWLVFSLIALGLIYPSFKSGYIFALDWIVKPFVKFSDINFTDPLGWALCDFFSVIFTFAIFQRIFLFSLILFSGLAGFRLVKKTDNLYAQYFSGLLLIFNPFFYARIVEQTMLIGAGIVAFYWFWVFLLEALEEGSDRKFLYSATIGALAISFFAHSLFFIGIVFLTFLIWNYWKNKNGKVGARRFLFFWLIVLALNGNWLAATFSGEKTWASKIVNFTQNDIETFRTRSIGKNSIYFTVLSMQGYWGEYQDRFNSIQENSLWRGAFCLVFILAVFGVAKRWRKKTITKPFIFLFIAAFILAIGISGPPFKSFTLFLYRYIPFYIGLREPQKWVVVLVFIYSYFGGWGVKYLLCVAKIRKWRKELAIFCVISPIIFSFSMIRGIHEHVVPHNFPVEWQLAKDHIEANQADGKILFFPWHSYLRLDFAGKNVINPAKAYFGRKIISGNNVEFGKVHSNFSDKQTQFIEGYVFREKNAEDFSEEMISLGISEIILAKTEDWQKYFWLETAFGVKKVLENDKLNVYVLQKK